MRRCRARMRANDPNLRDDPLVQQGRLRASCGRRRPACLRQRCRPSASSPRWPTTNVGKPLPARTRTPSHGRDIVIDVIVAYTKKAASNYSDVKRELVDLAIEEGNESFRMSGLGNVKLRLVHAYETDYDEEGRRTSTTSGASPTRATATWRRSIGLRDKYKADVGVLIVDDARGCGLATRVFADAERGLCRGASRVRGLILLPGARDRPSHWRPPRPQLDKNMTPFAYGHGFVNGTKWRDIMSYKESCGGCPRLPVWSSPSVLVKGEPAGTPELDNARVISRAGRARRRLPLSAPPAMSGQSPGSRWRRSRCSARRTWESRRCRA